MSLFRRKQGTTEERATWPVTGWLTAGYGQITAAGEPVSLENVMRSNAFAACRRVLVSEVAQLPVHTFSRVRDTRKKVPSPQIVAQPSSMLTQRGWVGQVMDSLARAGNAYLQVAVDDTGAIVQAETLSPSNVSWQSVDGVLRPHVGGVERKLWPAGNLVHIPATSFLMAGSPAAMRPVDMAAESLSMGFAAEKYTAEFFGSGGHPSSVLYVDSPGLSASDAEKIKDRYVEATKGRRPAVLGSGIKREAVQMPPDDAMLNLSRFVVEQACRTLGVPPSMVYGSVSGQSITYANVSDADHQFLKHSLGIWLADVEDHWTRLVPTRGHFVKFNLDALLRSTPKERAEINQIRLASKTMTVNEVRRLEDEPPFADPAYDEPGVPGGMPAGEPTNAT